MIATNLTIILSCILYLLCSAPTLTAFGYGFRAINKVASGFGTGTLVCPNGLKFNNEQMQFEVSKSKKVTEQVKKTPKSDNWSISALNPHPQTAHANSGSINGVNLSSSLKDILIKGSESQDNICQSVNGKGNALKINYISITGQCNTKDTIISFTSLDGKKGSFRGSIICSLIS
ncbi:MAG TPA: hypothetical protein VFJ05_00795 [Nitrososphaeraceae archaeon]|nr:hypothetical protein [Nitrososphaeraceae archaeon]